MAAVTSCENLCVNLFLSIMELSPVRNTEVKVAYKFSSSSSMPPVLVDT